MIRTPAVRVALGTAVAAILALIAGTLTGPAHAAPLTKVRPFQAAQAVGGKPLPQGVIQLSWGEVRRAKSYQVRWARNAKFRNAKSRSVTTTRTRLRGLAVGKKHWITVRAIRGKQRGAWSRVIATVPRPKRPGAFPAGSITSTRTNGGVQVAWGPSVNATRYRVQAGPFAGAAAVRGPWMAASTRDTVARGLEADLTTARFGNPLVTNVEAGNEFAPKTSRRGPTWRTTLPGAPAPAAKAVGVTVGTYNVLCDDCKTAQGHKARPWSDRGPEIAERIKQAGLDVAVLQEVQGHTAGVHLYQRFATDITDEIGGDWRLNNSDPYGAGTEGSRILYNRSKLTEVDTGLEEIKNRRGGGTTNVPWSLLRTVAEPATQFLVLSLHLGHGKGLNDVAQLEQLGEDVTALDAKIEKLRKDHAIGDRLPPVILGGDLYSNQTAERRRAIGPIRSLIGAGWWDSRQTKTRDASAAYSSTNQFQAQKPHPSGFGPRVDYLFSKGIGTQTRRYGVIAEPRDNAPSDHNLVWAEFALPRP